MKINVYNLLYIVIEKLLMLGTSNLNKLDIIRKKKDCLINIYFV